MSENARQLHEERHPAMKNYRERAHRLEKLRLTHALCSNLELTSWQRDRSITDDDQFTVLCEQHGLGEIDLNRLRRILTEKLDEQDLHDAVYGRNTYCDPSLPNLGAGTSA